MKRNLLPYLPYLPAPQCPVEIQFEEYYNHLAGEVSPAEAIGLHQQEKQEGPTLSTVNHT